VKAVLIGLGMVADTHLDALKAAQGITLHGVLARNATTTLAFADKAAEKLGHPVKAYEDLSGLADDPDIGFAIVATPPDSRAEIVEALTAAQIPILMEKPLERTLQAAREIVERCSAARIPLGIFFQHRARDVSQKLKKAIEEGVIGDIISAELRIPWWRAQSYYDAPGRGTYSRDGGGVMITQAIHTLDLAIWFLGPFKDIQALMHRTKLHEMEAEDWAGAVFRTKNGAVGHIMATTAAYPGAAESIILNGTKGAAHLEAGTLTIAQIDGGTLTYGKDVSTGGGADPMAFTHAWHQGIIEDFATSIRDKVSPIASGRDALRAHAVIDAMQRSSASGQRVEVHTS